MKDLNGNIVPIRQCGNPKHQLLEVCGRHRVRNLTVCYAFWVDAEPGPPFKAFYSPATVRQAVERNVFGGNWPAHIATLEEVEERARRDDALRHIWDAVKKFPRLAVLVFESQQVHVAQTDDHPNALAEVNAWLDASYGLPLRLMLIFTPYCFSVSV